MWLNGNSEGELILAWAVTTAKPNEYGLETVNWEHRTARCSTIFKNFSQMKFGLQYDHFSDGFSKQLAVFFGSAAQTASPLQCDFFQAAYRIKS